MSKIKTAFFCQNCGTQYAKWQGQCNACKEWNTIAEEIIQKEEAYHADKILAENGVPCLSCPMAQFEIDKLKIGEVCKMYELDLEKILTELNNAK